MSMGPSACRAWTIDIRRLKSLLKKPYSVFVNELEKQKMEFDEFCIRAQEGDFDDGCVPIQVAFVQLQEAFHKKTGLTLSVVHYDPDSGGPYDDLTGGTFIVLGVDAISPKGKKLLGKIKESWWIVYG